MQFQRLNTPCPPRSLSRRRGSAPLEFVMAMPVLLLLLVLILSVGIFSLGNLRATINARSTAFQQRTSHRSQRPLSYSQQTSRQDVYSAAATESPAYPSPKISFGPVTRRHSVLGGAWDHRELLQGNGPHWKDMARASSGSATNQITSLLDQFGSNFNVGSLPSLENIAGGLIGSLLGESSSASGGFSQLQAEQKQANQKNIQDLKDRNSQLKAERTQLQNDIDTMLMPKRQALTDSIKDSMAEIVKEKDADKKKALQKEQEKDQAELDDVNQQIKQKQDRISAIDHEIDANQGLIDHLQKI